MDDARHDAKELRRRFEECIQLLRQQDAGMPMDDEDAPMYEFNDILNEVSQGPIESEDHLQILRQGIDHIMKDPAEPCGSVQDAMDDALHEAILEAQSPLQAALLALARHGLKGNRIHVLSA